MTKKDGKISVVGNVSDGALRSFLAMQAAVSVQLGKKASAINVLNTVLCRLPTDALYYVKLLGVVVEPVKEAQPKEPLVVARFLNPDGSTPSTREEALASKGEPLEQPRDGDVEETYYRRVGIGPNAQERFNALERAGLLTREDLF